MTIMSGALLQQNAEGLQVLTEQEITGMKIFVGKGRCITCHVGPLLSDFAFHNTGVPNVDGAPPDLGAIEGVAKLVRDEFNCASRYVDAPPPVCKFPDNESPGSFRTPMLRAAAPTAPYMHAGQFATLAEVVDHYDRAPDAESGSSELMPLGLTKSEKSALVAFLETLWAPMDVAAELLVAPE